MFRPYLSAFQIGIIAGMRAMSAPALVSHRLSHIEPAPLADSKLHFLTSPKTATITKVMAAGELVGDKLPSSPDRTAFPQILGRIGSGAACGAALSEVEGNEASYGAVAGSLGALVGTFAFFHLRRWLTHDKGIPDPLVALAEDALTIGWGWKVVEAVQPSGLHVNV